MLNKIAVVKKILKDQTWTPATPVSTAFASSNIALAKYWGKRNTELNLPMNASLSISLAHKGAEASLGLAEETSIVFNGKILDLNEPHAQRLQQFLKLFAGPEHAEYECELDVNIPFAAGLASSACIFAALTLALKKLYDWHIPESAISILARLGSGSACRSIFPGFALWQAGEREDGMDSFATQIDIPWPNLAIGLNVLDAGVKSVSSREGMQRTVTTSPLYSAWPAAANHAVQALQEAIPSHNFAKLGQIAEQNALTMHATMQSAWPPLLYATENTLNAMHQVWRLRDEGLAVYFTQDAGPNLKLLCQQQDLEDIAPYFPKAEWIFPFAKTH